jgi:predicted HTH domain antitoxin
MMTVSFELPDNIEKQLRQELDDLDAAAKEATLVELYRQGQLSHGKLAESLGISRYETDAVLKRHNVTEDLLTRAEFDEQTIGLRKLLGQ